MLHYFALALESALKEMKGDALSLLWANFKTVSLILWIKSCSVGMTIQMKATEQYFPVVLSINYSAQGGSNFWVCGWNPNVWPVKWKSYWAVLSCGTLYFAVQDGSNFWVCGLNPLLWPFQLKATERYFPVTLFNLLYRVALTFESVDEILKCYHSNESYFAAQGGFDFWVCRWNPSVWSLVWMVILRYILN